LDPGAGTLVAVGGSGGTGVCGTGAVVAVVGAVPAVLGVANLADDHGEEMGRDLLELGHGVDQVTTPGDIGPGDEDDPVDEVGQRKGVGHRAQG